MFRPEDLRIPRAFPRLGAPFADRVFHSASVPRPRPLGSRTLNFTRLFAGGSDIDARPFPRGPVPNFGPRLFDPVPEALSLRGRQISEGLLFHWGISGTQRSGRVESSSGGQSFTSPPSHRIWRKGNGSPPGPSFDSSFVTAPFQVLEEDEECPAAVADLPSRPEVVAGVALKLAHNSPPSAASAEEIASRRSSHFVCRMEWRVVSAASSVGP